MFGGGKDDKRPGKAARVTGVLLWAAAFILMAMSAVHQRKTGPTYPLKGEFDVQGRTLAYKLIRSQELDGGPGARVMIPDPGLSFGGTLHYKRFRTTDVLTPVPMLREFVDEKPMLVGVLPAQPPAGKLEYFITVADSAGVVANIPDRSVIIRFKGAVSPPILITHIILMVIALLVALRAGLGAILLPGSIRRLCWTTLLFMTAGGMIFGPLVQKQAFGSYWTGFPLGGDWTDNKTLIMWLAWIVACGAVGLGRSRPKLVRRLIVIGAMIVTMVTYLVPHSLGGSELDYAKLEQGVAPEDAIGTGRK